MKRNSSSVPFRQKRRRVEEEEEEEEEDWSSDEDSSSDEEEEELNTLQEQLAEIPFADRVSARVDGHLQKEKASRKTQRGGKASKSGGPMEVSSKRKVGYMASTSRKKHTKERRDPRYDETAGEFRPDLFMKNYEFLQDANDREQMKMKKKLRRAKDPELRANLQKDITASQKHFALAKQRESELARQKKRRKQATDAVAAGRKPFYLKKSQERRVAMEEKFEELKTKKGVANYMAKRLKKKAQKEQRSIPRERRMVSEE